MGLKTEEVWNAHEKEFRDLLDEIEELTMEARSKMNGRTATVFDVDKVAVNLGFYQQRLEALMGAMKKNPLPPAPRTPKVSPTDR